MKNGSSGDQQRKNQFWQIRYFKSLFYLFHKRFPNNIELSLLIDHNLRSKEYPLIWQPIIDWITKYPNLNIELWSKNTQTYRNDDIGYLINHQTGVIYIIDKSIMKFPPQAYEGHYTIYKNKFHFQQYIDNKFNRNDWANMKRPIGRACSPYLYVKKISGENNKMKCLTKKAFAQIVDTRLNNLNLYYDKVRGHKGYWISTNKTSEVFYNHKLPKHGHFTIYPKTLLIHHNKTKI
ncbi:MAG: hypothetical protein LBS76_00980 [Mycoplasmataceae bacterium]|nr:hypothetical protein [Mycoplasmataceae bacterium]